MFLKLTRTDDTKVRVNSESISFYGFYNSFTTVTIQTHTLYVKETPEQIDKLLEESHIFFKGVDGQMEGKR